MPSPAAPVVVLVHVQHFPDLGGAVYTAAVPRKRAPHDYIGEDHVVEPWAAGSEGAAWTYACMHAVLAAVEAGYTIDQIVVRGDRADIGRLVKTDWDGLLGIALLRFRMYCPDVRFRIRAGDRFTGPEIATYRAMLVEHQATGG